MITYKSNYFNSLLNVTGRQIEQRFKIVCLFNSKEIQSYYSKKASEILQMSIFTHIASDTQWLEKRKQPNYSFHSEYVNTERKV